jgi:hypothetical protein
MANKGAGSGNFFMGSGAKFGLTLNPKRAPKKPVLAAPLAAFGADAEEEQDDAGNNFRGARELAREQEANSVANARVQVCSSVLWLHVPAVSQPPGMGVRGAQAERCGGQNPKCAHRKCATEAARSTGEQAAEGSGVCLEVPRGSARQRGRAVRLCAMEVWEASQGRLWRVHAFGNWSVRSHHLQVSVRLSACETGG